MIRISSEHPFNQHAGETVYSGANFAYPDGRILGLIAVRLSVLPRSSTLWSPVGKSLLVASLTTPQVAFSGPFWTVEQTLGRIWMF